MSFLWVLPKHPQKFKANSITLLDTPRRMYANSGPDNTAREVNKSYNLRKRDPTHGRSRSNIRSQTKVSLSEGLTEPLGQAWKSICQHKCKFPLARQENMQFLAKQRGYSCAAIGSSKISTRWKEDRYDGTKKKDVSSTRIAKCVISSRLDCHSFSKLFLSFVRFSFRRNSHKRADFFCFCLFVFQSERSAQVPTSSF